MRHRQQIYIYIYPTSIPFFIFTGTAGRPGLGWRPSRLGPQGPFQALLDGRLNFSKRCLQGAAGATCVQVRKTWEIAWKNVGTVQLAPKNNEQRQWSKPLQTGWHTKKQFANPYAQIFIPPQNTTLWFWSGFDRSPSHLLALCLVRHSVLVGAPPGYWTKMVLPLFLLSAVLYVLVFFSSLLSTVFSSPPLSLANQHKFVLESWNTVP